MQLTVVSGGYTTTLKMVTDAAGATTMTLGDSTGVQMVVNLNAQGVGTGTVTMNGQKVADIAVASDGYMTITYSDGSSNPPVYLGGLA